MNLVSHALAFAERLRDELSDAPVTPKQAVTFGAPTGEGHTLALTKEDVQALKFPQSESAPQRPERESVAPAAPAAAMCGTGGAIIGTGLSANQSSIQNQSQSQSQSQSQNTNGSSISPPHKPSHHHGCVNCFQIKL